MAGEGRLTITARMFDSIGSGALQPGTYICLSVADTGAGMDKDTLRRATEPFFTTKHVGEGTGLGLSTVQGLAEQSGGTFSLESEVGQGTIATLCLPTSTSRLSDSVLENETEPVPRRVDATPVLLVDDEELVRVGTADMLTEAGYRVTEASSGYQALELLQRGLDVQVLVTDYAMPSMTGTELAREALALRPGLQVLLITGYTSVADREAGNIRRLAKPFRLARLAVAVDDLLRSARPDSTSDE